MDTDCRSHLRKATQLATAFSFVALVLFALTLPLVITGLLALLVVVPIRRALIWLLMGYQHRKWPAEEQTPSGIELSFAHLEFAHRQQCSRLSWYAFPAYIEQWCQYYFIQFVLPEATSTHELLSSENVCELARYGLLTMSMCSHLAADDRRALFSVLHETQYQPYGIELIFAQPLAPRQHMVGLINRVVLQYPGQLTMLLQLFSSLKRHQLLSHEILSMIRLEVAPVSLLYRLRLFLDGLSSVGLSRFELRRCCVLMVRYHDTMASETVSQLIGVAKQLAKHHLLNVNSMNVLFMLYERQLFKPAICQQLINIGSQEHIVTDTLCLLLEDYPSETPQLIEHLMMLGTLRYPQQAILTRMQQLNLINPQQFYAFCLRGSRLLRLPLKTIFRDLDALNEQLPDIDEDKLNEFTTRLIQLSLSDISMQKLYFELYRLLEQSGLPLTLALNHAQSTHTASVHQSTSRSALRLYHRYQQQLADEQDEQRIDHDMYQFIAQHAKQRILKRALVRLVTGQTDYVDGSSQLSLASLCRLAWCAVNDIAAHHLELSDARAVFVEALLEIQRGYNHSDETEESDKPICHAGAFNKFIEKLRVVHPDVEQCYMTHQTAALKFPCLVHEMAMEYLTQHPAAIEAVLSVGDYTPIIDQISCSIRCRFYQEFKELYRSPNNEEFVSLVAAIEYVELNDKHRLALRAVQPLNPACPSFTALTPISDSAVNDNQQHESYQYDCAVGD